MNKQLLKLLERDARMSVADLSTVTGLSEDAVRAEIAEMQKDGLIRGYKGVIDWERVDPERVSAMIELKVTPKAGLGFEEVAERIAQYPEVESVYLMSGSYDLNVVVKGRTFHEVTNFVARELALIDSVTSTSTSFVMRRYKDLDVELTSDERDERGVISL